MLMWVCSNLDGSFGILSYTTIFDSAHFALRQSSPMKNHIYAYEKVRVANQALWQGCWLDEEYCAASGTLLMLRLDL